MSDALFSPYWYRVKALKPRLRAQVQLYRHEVRKQIWYVLHDHTNRRNYRFSWVAYRAIALMDGSRTVQSVWETCNTELGDDAPTQEQLIQLLAQLHAADVLQCDVSPDARELLQRYNAQDQQRWHRQLKNPLSLRIPLYNPEKLLNLILPWVAPVFSRLGLTAWLVCLLSALVLAGRHWPELTENILDRVTTPQNLVLFWLIYPLVKIVHEFGHALTAKKAGGEVPEMGLMLIALLPIPYVDVSSSNAFPDKYQRMAVGGAGIMVDLFTASLALFLWLLVEPGLIRTAAFDVMLIGGLSSLFFNGNPLLRYDGYYVFVDAIEIPNLASRSGQYLAYLVKRYLFGLTDAPSPVAATGEAKWLLSYGVASWIYRNIVLFFLLLFVIREYFALGVIIAVTVVTMQILLPLAKTLLFPLTSPLLMFRRLRAVSTTMVISFLLVLLLFAIPLPSWTTTEGVIWLPDDSIIRTKTSGIVGKLVSRSDDKVMQDAPLIELEDPFLLSELQVLEAKRTELDARYAAQWMSHQVEANIVLDELRSVQAGIRRTRERIDGLTLRSPATGTIIIPDVQDLPGRFVRQGEALAYLIDGRSKLTVRAMIPQENIGLVRQHTRAIHVKLVGESGKTYSADFARQVPEATDKLPSAVLGTVGGGSLAVDPTKENSMTLLEKQFQLELEIQEPGDPIQVGIGRRVYIRFDHEFETLGNQFYRGLRQLFLRQIYV